MIEEAEKSPFQQSKDLTKSILKHFDLVHREPLSRMMKMIENDYPLTFLRYGLVPNSGGEGKSRGGLGLVREFRLDAPEGTFAANLDRFKIAPYGLEGGEPGRVGQLIMRRSGSDTEEILASKVAGLNMKTGDIIRLETAGGGGHGNPKDRSKSDISDDLFEGYTT